MTAPVNTTLYMRPDRNLALELVRVTEAGAMAAGRWVGRGDKEAGDGAAVDAMRQLVASVSMRGVVVIGEGEKDEAPMLYNGEEVGNGLGPDCDFAVDPVDGTTLMAKGMPNAISVLAVAERGAMFDPSAVFYMEKIAVGPDAADAIDITAPVSENLRKVAQGEEVVGVRSDRVHPGPSAPRRAECAGPGDWRPDQADLRGRCCRRDRGGASGVGHRPAPRPSGRGSMRQTALHAGSQSRTLGRGSSTMSSRVTDCLPARRWSRATTNTRGSS